MKLVCQWTDRGETWVCSQCGAIVSKDIVPEEPFAACVKGMRHAGIKPEDMLNARVPAPPPEIPDGPGTELKKMLAWLGITAAPGCRCNQRAVTMNLWGADECERRIDEIVAWLKEEAERRKMPFVETAARLLVRRAIRSARKAQKPPLTE